MLNFKNLLTRSGGSVIAIVFLDQLSKFLVVNNLRTGSLYKLFDLKYFGINLTLTYNLGVAFGWFNYIGNWQNIVFLTSTLIVILSISYLIITKKITAKLELIGFLLILSGAIGNALDRWHYGAVVDLIDFYIVINNKPWHWYTFNIADSAICLGVIGVLLNLQVKAS